MPKLPALPGQSGRISKRLQKALHLITSGGRSITDAAKEVGMARETLSRSLKKPHVAAERERLMKDLIQSEGQRSIAVMATLRDNAASEHVRLDAAARLAALAGYTPKNPAVNTNITLHTPGWIIDLRPPEDTSPIVIDGYPLNEEPT